MHELSVTENILEIALRHAKSANAIKITDLYLVIGDLSSIIDDSVKFYWDIISKDTIAENSSLHFKRIHTTLNCRECNFEYQADKNALICPNCGGTNVSIISGNEFYLDSINIT